MIASPDMHRQGNGRISPFWLYWNCDFVFSSQRCLFHQGCAELPQMQEINYGDKQTEQLKGHRTRGGVPSVP